MRRAVVLALCACNQVYGLDPTQLRPDAPPDASPERPVVPPDGKTTCGALPDFESWTYAPATLPALEGESARTFHFYRRPEAIRAIMQSLYEKKIYDGTLDGEPRVLILPVDPDSPDTQDSVYGPGIAPDGSAIWYYERRLSRVSFATAAQNWTLKRRSDLGFPDAISVFPSRPGFYDGTLRMVIDLHEVNKPARFAEISSLDGLAWTPLDTMQVALIGTQVFGLTLTADGCFLFFVASNLAGGYLIQVVPRDSDGVFRQAPIALQKLTDATSKFPVMVAPMPALDEIWSFDAQANRIVRGTPQ